uniref:Uncharacterized protein n=1 Tax=Panagrolaimus superbus TaxID=310955 RepID=A0A914ZGC2_9BILA
MTQHAQQLRFSERENEEESLKTILEECQKEKIFVETNVVQLYTQIWPNFLQKARNNFYANGLTKIDQIVMDISKTRNPHWWGPPVASKNARARAIRDFNPPKVKIIEPQHAATSGSGRRKRKDVGESVIPAPSVKVAKMKKNPPVNIDYQTPLTSKPRQPPWLTLKNVEPRRRKQQQPTSEIPSNNFPPAPPVFKIPALPPSLSNPNTLSTIASLIRSLSAAQSTAAASSTNLQQLWK